MVEFDRFFYSEVGDDPAAYDWSSSHSLRARAWNLARVRRAIDAGADPVVLDDDCGVGTTARVSARYAVEHGYSVEFAEPRTPWWQRIRVLLETPEQHSAELETWAVKLSLLNRGTHRVCSTTIARRMRQWRTKLTVEDLLSPSTRPL